MNRHLIRRPLYLHYVIYSFLLYITVLKAGAYTSTSARLGTMTGSWSRWVVCPPGSYVAGHKVRFANTWWNRDLDDTDSFMKLFTQFDNAGIAQIELKCKGMNGKETE